MNRPLKWMALKCREEKFPILDWQRAQCEVLSSRRTREGCWEAVCGRPRVEQPLVQILVVVANTQVENVLLEDRSGEGFHINSKYI